MAAHLPASKPIRSAYAPGEYPTDPEGRVWLVRKPLSRHQLRRPPAWCIDARQLGEARQRGAVGVVLLVADTGAHLYAPLAFVDTYGRSMDRGFGRQVAVALQDWQPFTGAWPPSDLSEHCASLTANTARHAPPRRKRTAAPTARQEVFDWSGLPTPNTRPWHELDEQPKPGRPVGWQQPERLPFE